MNWLLKNIVPVLAVMIVGTTLSLYVLSVTKAVEIHADILRDLRDLCIIIVSFYFGSSIGSKEKTAIMNDKNKS